MARPGVNAAAAFSSRSAIPAPASSSRFTATRPSRTEENFLAAEIVEGFDHGGGIAKDPEAPRDALQPRVLPRIDFAEGRAKELQDAPRPFQMTARLVDGGIVIRLAGSQMLAGGENLFYISLPEIQTHAAT